MVIEEKEKRNCNCAVSFFFLLYHDCCEIMSNLLKSKSSPLTVI